MTIIVTGGAGFIGSNFIFYMLKKHADYRIVCLDKLTYAGNLSTLASIADNPSFRFVKADICDKQAVEKLFEEEKPDIIVNLRQNRMLTALLKIREYSLKPIYSARKHLWMRAENTALSDIIRSPPMRFTVICRWTGPIYSLPKKRLFTHHRLTAPQRRLRIYWCLPTIEHTVCP